MPQDAAPDNTAARAIGPLEAALAASVRDLATVPVVVGDAAPIPVPRTALRLLTEVLSHLAAGRRVSIVATDAGLTTQQAADLLGVSRPHLVSLLDSRKIDFYWVGKHRRVVVESLKHYRHDRQRPPHGESVTTAEHGPHADASP